MGIKVQNTPNRLAFDVKSSQDIREAMQKDPKAGLQAAAQQFETMFLQMVMKSMRDATPQDGPFNSEQTRFYTAMLDQQLAQNMATGKGLGFAKLIEQQLGGALQGSDPSAALSAAKTAGNAMPLATPDLRHLQAPALAKAAETVQNAVAQQAVAGTGQAGEAVSPTAKEFVNKVWPHAVEASRSTGIPPQFLVAHAALESGWGKSEIRKADGSTSYNLFGIKAGKSWSGGATEAATTEYVDGEAQRVTAKFRSYGSYAEAFNDYASLLRNNPRYGSVIGSQDGTEFAKRLQQAGYATDPAYADKLSRIISGPTLRQALIG